MNIIRCFWFLGCFALLSLVSSFVELDASSAAIFVAAFFIVIFVVVFVHEFGHYLAARFCGVTVEEFSVGFGWKVCSFKDSVGTSWSIGCLPLGGYVKLLGDNLGVGSSDQECNIAGSMLSKPIWKRAIIVASGPLANFLFSWIVLTVLFSAKGYHHYMPIIAKVQEHSPAAEAGLKPGDKIVSVDGVNIKWFDDLRDVIAASPSSRVTLVYKRGDALRSVEVVIGFVQVPDMTGHLVTIGSLGVHAGGSLVYEKLSLFGAALKSYRELCRISVATLRAIGQIFVGSRSADEVGGPVRVAQYSGFYMKSGLFAFLWFLSMISANLGLINLFPIAPLDGGRLLGYLLTAIFGGKLIRLLGKYASIVGVAVMVLVMVVATFNDIRFLLGIGK